MDQKTTDHQTTRETREIMNVESFSQLPFIRPAPVAKKPIRLFGKELGGDSVNYNNNTESSQTTNAVSPAIVRGVDTRKYECHYCCKNFPTSQALGGHQNGHKRERQHAKRAQLQSSVHGSLGEPADFYGLINYRLRTAGGSSLSPTSALTTSAYHYSNFVNAYNGVSPRYYGGARAYGSNYSPRLPMTGSPLGLWRVPEAHNSSGSVPLFGNEELKSAQVSMGVQTRLGCESSKAKMEEELSLDLHL